MKKTLCLVIGFIAAEVCAAQSTALQLDKLLSSYAIDHRFNGSVLVPKKGNYCLIKAMGLIT
jgi:hypothetical protein